MSQNTTWVVVANSAQAKIYRMVHFPQIEEINSLEHPESRLHNKDLVTDRPGSTTEKSGSRHASYEPDTQPKEVEVEKFAKMVSTYLVTACQKDEFSRLYIMASPHFLGLLRQNFDPKTQNSIVKEVAKNYIELKKADIEQHLKSNI